MNSQRWIDAEPGLDDLMNDPIMQLLLRGDGIDERQVFRAVELARRNWLPPARPDWLLAAS
ncbi:MAG TPA: hypothetical protein VM689_23950 [Aliidongia sp.]|nr:hypothetical protein [Aliidongia sp.]